MIHRGEITRVDGTKVYVKVPELGGSKEFGPIDCIRAKQPTIVNNTAPNNTSAASAGTAHTHPLTLHNHTVTNTHYDKGDKVIVAQIGVVPENLVVLGRI